MADMDEITRIARGCGAVVVEDCAHAIGSSHHGRSAGSMGDIGCFSFQATKNVSTLGQGGLIVCSDDRWAERIERVRSYEPDASFVPAPGIRLGEWAAPTSGVPGHEKNAFTHECREIQHGGMNGVLSEAAAAVGLVQLDRLEGLLARRAQIASIFDEGLAGIDGVRVQTYAPELRHAHHLYTFFADPDSGIDREELVGEIDRRGVQVVLRYFPLHLLPEWRFRGAAFGDCPVAERVWFTEQVNLPIYPALSDDDAELVVEIVRDAFDTVRR
jgi:perosamine synthetase